MPKHLIRRGMKRADNIRPYIIERIYGNAPACGDAGGSADIC